ncbi:MAG: hypothetical protein K4571_17545 [Deltaproteobacteria bacterium]
MFSFRLIVILLVTCTLLAAPAFCEDFRESDAQVWKVGQRRWTILEEENYSKWIEANVAEDFFVRYNIRVDCADVPYALRWIYARIAHLPAAASPFDRPSIGHWSKDWAHLPTDARWDKDRRFRAALSNLFSKASTRSLRADTYPIRITTDSVNAGTVFLAGEDHAGIIIRIVLDGSTIHPVQTLEAGSPARIQRMHLRNLLLPDPGGDNISGLLRFRWPVKMGRSWRYLPEKDHPYYSEEQYSPSFSQGYFDYLEAIAKRIDPKVYDQEEKAGKIIDSLTRRLNQRIPVVLEGYEKCRKTRCREGSPIWEIYSTPGRDEFISVIMSHLDELIDKNGLDRNAILDKMAKIRLQITPDRSVTLQYVFQNFQWLSSDPDATIEARWGLDKCGMIATQMKSARESISFIQKKYGRKDPVFAEHSTWTQQKIVDEMIRESEKSNCTEMLPQNSKPNKSQ